VGLLTIADLFIAYFIYRFKGLLLGILFFVNPISIIISGYHNQFDNLAIAVACLAVIKLNDFRRKHLDFSDFTIVFLFGTSLAIKHILLFFVIWVAIRQKTMFLRCFYLFGPFLVFGLSFTPYLASSWNSIELNVLKYRSFNNAPLWRLLGVYDGYKDQLSKVLFVVLILFIGFILRKVQIQLSLLVYCIVSVAFAPAIANQYLVIATIGAIGLLNIGFSMYVLYGAFWLVISSDGLHFTRETLLDFWCSP
jgi:hypothetical protein